MDVSDEPWQLQYLRDGLEVFRDVGVQEGGVPFAWPSISEAIWEVTAVKIPYERLRKFVMGEPDKKSGIHRYPSLSEERLKAVIAFLTQEDSEGYMFPPEDLEIKPTGRSVIYGLARHLNEYVLSKNLADPAHLCGLFISKQTPTDISVTVTLRFSNSTQLGIVPFVLSKQSENEIKMGEKAKTKAERYSARNNTMDKYHGWAVLTPEGSLLLIAQNDDTYTNLFYITLGIDKALYLSQPVNSLVLLEIDQPDDSVLVQIDHKEDNTESMLANIREVFFQQLMLFKRKN